MNEYMGELNTLPSQKIVKQMTEYAKTHKIPVISDEGLIMLFMLFDIVKPRKFLEIGTAVGYCSINLALYNNDVIIDTIEKNDEMYVKALENIHKAGLAGRINVLNADALTFDTGKLSGDYDIIFIDAAKAQYMEYFEMYKHQLSADGLIVTDNLLFHGLVMKTADIMSKDLRHLTIKIKKFNQWLAKNKEFRTSFFVVGDGMAVSRRAGK